MAYNLKQFQAVAFLDHARIHSAYNDNSPASCLAEWLFFNARAMIKAEATGDADYMHHLERLRQKLLSSPEWFQ